LPRSAPTAASPSAPASSPRPSAWPAIWAFVAAFFLTLGSSILFVFAVAWVRVSGDRSRLYAEATAFALSPVGLILGALGNAVVLAGVAFVTALAERRSPASRLRLRPTRASPLGVAATLAGMLALSIACGAATELLRVRGGGAMDAMAEAFRAPSPARFLGALLAIGVAPGIAEEAFFRGAMQTRLVASWGRWPGIAATAAGFGLIHLDAVQGGLAFVAGLFLGWIVERFDGIRPTIGAHIANNALFVTLAALGDGGEGSRAVRIGAVAVGGVVWIASVAVLRSPRALRAASIAPDLPADLSEH
jgi:membrane protease YdiL (CAAX protease family)